VTVPADRKPEFEEAMGSATSACIGSVTDDPRLRVSGLDGSSVIDADVLELKEAWKGTFDAI